ncbi:phage terminase small subunit P27 family [Clostridium botulinum]|uniref:phage terminase small subunit P27 family n=1 Tax=Clostridium botulinum TaxID=1491 RepID=UPI00059D5A2E|nr:phage terminase small subunit P27 family [Clostridium botulinum]KIN79931.1 terminase [Clostridium botulinum]MCC5426422.1 phage terminase small subunit P27 family [Clostridium botulinum]
MSRPRQPIDLIVAKGKKNLTKKEIEDRKSKEVQAPADKIKPPSYLPSNLKKEFTRIAGELISIEIMSNLDCEALARFIVSEYNYQKVTKKLLKTGVDNEKYTDLLLMQEKLFKMCRQGAGDLGLTISSRCKLVIPKNEEKKELTEEEKLFGGRV